MTKICHFREFFHFYPVLDYYKIRTRTNLENPNGKSFRSASNNVIYSERIFLELNRFHGSHFQNTPNIKTFFGNTLHTCMGRQTSSAKYTLPLSTPCLLSLIISSGKSKTSDRSEMSFFQNLNSARIHRPLVCLGQIECNSRFFLCLHRRAARTYANNNISLTCLRLGMFLVRYIFCRNSRNLVLGLNTFH